MAPPPPPPPAPAPAPLLPDITLTPAEKRAYGNGAVVAVTGAGGYVASALVARLLAAGATVRACVRSEASASHLRELAARYGAGKLELVTGCDLLVPGSFDAALRGTSVVFHTASPFQMAARGDDLLRAAVGGTREVLSACARVGGSTLERVILTSSVAALHAFVPADRAGDRGGPSGRPYSPADWNDVATTSFFPYEHSKAAAERWAWRFVHAASGGKAPVPPGALGEATASNNKDADDESSPERTAAAALSGSSNNNNKPITWTLSVVNPAFVLGPPLSSRADGESTNIACKLLQGGMMGAWPDVHFGACDVRDVALVHALAGALSSAAGKRLIVAPHRASFGDLVSSVKRDPQLVPRVRLPRRAAFYAPMLVLSPLLALIGLPPYRLRRTYGVPAASYDCSQAEALIREGGGGGAGGASSSSAVLWTPFDTTAQDMARALLARGLVRDASASV